MVAWLGEMLLCFHIPPLLAGAYAKEYCSNVIMVLPDSWLYIPTGQGMMNFNLIMDHSPLWSALAI